MARGECDEYVAPSAKEVVVDRDFFIDLHVNLSNSLEAYGRILEIAVTEENRQYWQNCIDRAKQLQEVIGKFWGEQEILIRVDWRTGGEDVPSKG